ncbi:MAG: response regulator [Labilithrix sp.]|nr:response regulator [Labilithrix sp.]MCW5811346.1 response regulator [Labilithrix sp.]
MSVPKPTAEDELAAARGALREMEARFELLTQLQGLGVALAGARTASAVIELLVERGAATLSADASAFIRRDGDEVYVLKNTGVPADVTKAYARFSISLRVAGVRALRTAEPEWIENNAAFVEQYPDSPSHAITGASCSLPLVASGHVLGVVSFRFAEPRVFDAAERAFILTFAGQAAQALASLEAAQRELSAKAWLATTLRSIGDAVIATDKLGRVTMMNPIAVELTGWPEAEALGRPLGDVFMIVNEKTRAPVVSPVDRVLEVGTVVGLANHTVLIGRGGATETPIDDSGAPIRGEDGAIEGVVLVFRDVTEKKRAETRRELLELASAALGESLDYDVTLAKVARLAVPGFADWCGVDVVEEGATTTRQVAVAHVDPAKVAWAIELAKKYPPPPDAPHGVPNVLRTGRSELYPLVTEEMIRAAAQDEEHLRISLELRLRSVIIVPLRAHGHTLGALSFVRTDDARELYDESDLAFAEDLAARCASAIDNARIYDAEQRARAAADVANRAKDEFLAMVSHELRTPLNAIMGWAKMLASGALDEAKRSRAVATIDRNAVAMAQLIEDLLDISRIISGKMRLEVQPVNLGRVIEAAIDSIRPAADAKEIQILERTDAEAQSVSGDPARLQQVVWNLLSNAVKFTPRGGRIDVELVREQESVEIAVTDTGRGIDARFIPHVFEPFRQEDASHTRSRGGLGLGLAITRQLVELHGGNIAAESEGEGKGATFRVQLPAGGSAGAPALQRTGRVRKFRIDSVFEQLPKLDGVHALVVDDEEDARTLVKTVLEELGARVTLAASVAEALAAVAREVPTVLVSDIGMPGQDGYDLIRALRALPPERGGAIPATALTAYARAEDRRRTIDAGFNMHVSKPVDPAELVAVVASLARGGARP